MIKSTKFLTVVVLAIVLLNGCSENEENPVVSKISIYTPPTKIDYFSGESLEFSDLVIEIGYDNGDTLAVEADDFASVGITAVPEAGALVTDETTQVVFTHEESGLSAEQIIYYLSLVDIEGNEYKAVRIGEQIWMKENLRTTKFQNGDEIETTNPVLLDIEEETDPIYQWVYDGDENLVEKLGRLYTNSAFLDDRNVCPAGWHIPTELDAWELHDFLSSDGQPLAKILASTTDWIPQSGSTVPGFKSQENNSSGFTAIPAGSRHPGVSSEDEPIGFTGFGEESRHWLKRFDYTVPEYEPNGYYMTIHGANGGLSFVEYSYPNSANSIRCIKDIE